MREYLISSYTQREILNNVISKIKTFNPDIKIVKCPTDASHVYAKNNNDTCRIYYKNGKERILVYHFEFR